MSDTSRTTRITTVVVGVVVAGVITATALGFSRSSEAADDSTSTPQSATSSTSSTAVTAVTDPQSTAPATPTPQPTSSAPLESAAPIRPGLTAEVVAMKALQGRATQPGDVAGPAVRFTIRLHNAGSTAISLSDAVVNATYGSDQEPAYPLSEGTPFPAKIAPGASATGVYVFTVPESARETVSVSIDTSTSDSVVAFTGSAPR